MNREKIRKKVISFLKKDIKKGMSKTDLIRVSKLTDNTIRDTLSYLEGAKKISFKKIGVAKVYYLIGGKDE